MVWSSDSCFCSIWFIFGCCWVEIRIHDVINVISEVKISPEDKTDVTVYTSWCGFGWFECPAASVEKTRAFGWRPVLVSHQVTGKEIKKRKTELQTLESRYLICGCSGSLWRRRIHVRKLSSWRRTQIALYSSRRPLPVLSPIWGCVGVQRGGKQRLRRAEIRPVVVDVGVGGLVYL